MLNFAVGFVIVNLVAGSGWDNLLLRLAVSNVKKTYCLLHLVEQRVVLRMLRRRLLVALCMHRSFHDVPGVMT